MAIVRDEGLVLRSMRYRETSRLLVALTPKYGKVHLLAKGAREYKRGFGGALEPLTRSQLVFYYKRSRELHLVHSASAEYAYLGLLRRPACFHLACAALEFVLRVVPDEDPSPEIYAALAAFLESGDAGGSPAQVLWELRVFQFGTIALLGYAPGLDRCVACGRPVPGGRTFGVAEGGILCSRCRPEGETLPLSAASLDLLRRLAGHAESGSSAGAGACPSPGAHPASAGRQVAAVVESFLQYHLPGYHGLRSLKSLADWQSLRRGAGADRGAPA